MSRTDVSRADVSRTDAAPSRPFPRGALFAAAVMILAAMAVAGLARVTGIGTTQLAPSPAFDVMELRFEDGADGSVAVLTPDGTLIETIPAGSGGFVRGVMRGFARDRRAHELGPERPFQLVRRADGHLVLEDPATGRKVELDSFGPENTRAFARFMTSPNRTPR